jgi:hypothetical protein
MAVGQNGVPGAPAAELVVTEPNPETVVAQTHHLQTED